MLKAAPVGGDSTENSAQSGFHVETSMLAGNYGDGAFQIALRDVATIRDRIHAELPGLYENFSLAIREVR